MAAEEARTIRVEPDDEGPMDEEHVAALVASGNAAETLDALNVRLRVCKRPATACLFGQVRVVNCG